MKATLLVILALAWGLAVTADVHAHPDDYHPNLDLNQQRAVWEATFFLDEDPDHILLGTMRVCFTFASNSRRPVKASIHQVFALVFS